MLGRYLFGSRGESPASLSQAVRLSDYLAQSETLCAIQIIHISRVSRDRKANLRGFA